MAKRKSLSETLIDAASEMGLGKATIKELTALNIPEVKEFSAKKIKALRKRENVSQGVFAIYLNVTPSTVQKWERGEVSPKSAALRLLNIIDKQGLGTIAED